MSPTRFRFGALGAGVVLAGAVSISAQQAPAPRSFSIDDLAWIGGVWKSDNDKGPTVEEHWMAPAGGVMCGMGRMVSNGRAVFFEYLRIGQEKDGSVVYYALPFGRGTPTPFTLTSLEGTRAVFENPQHDDPKVITYTLEGDRLTAVTEGEKDGKPTRNVFSMKRSAN